MSARWSVLVLLTLGCDSHSLPGTRWVGTDGWSFPEGPVVFAEATSILGIGDDVPARLGIVTWPELTPIESVVTLRETNVPPLRGTYAWATPLIPLQDRWYAMRWSGETRPSTTVHGIPLADGSRVWRFHATYIPEFLSFSYGTDALVLWGGGRLRAAGSVRHAGAGHHRGAGRCALER